MHLVIEVDGTRREVEPPRRPTRPRWPISSSTPAACPCRPTCPSGWTPPPRGGGPGPRRRAHRGQPHRPLARRGGRAGPGLAASLSAGLEAGWTVPVPRDDRCSWAGPRRPTSPSTPPAPPGATRRSRVEGEVLRVRDAGSTNGTFVGGEKVGEDGATLDDGDVVVVGGAAVDRVARRGRGPRPSARAPCATFTHAATVPFNRPPRPGLPPRADPRSSRRPASPSRRPPASASPRSSRRC